jgi:alpha-galactosidase
MKFILWFEPERVAKGTQIAEEYPQYVFGGSNGGLFKLNDPEARKFLTELILTRIKQFGVDVYRQDFNIDPLGFWRANDAPNRQGMTEIRYVEGHYEMWNRLRSEAPGLWIDNCASGGRRIDLETISMSVPLWRSDTNCSPGHPEWNQTQTLGLTQYIPLFACCAWEADPYTARSAATMGPIYQYNFLDNNYDLALTRASIMESQINQKFWYGDFYPLSEVKSGKNNLLAWQLHREDLEAGIIYIFRQGDCPYTEFELSPYAIDDDATYEITIKRDYAVGNAKTLSGKQFAKLNIELPEKQSTAMVEYRKIKNNKL